MSLLSTQALEGGVSHVFRWFALACLVLVVLRWVKRPATLWVLAGVNLVSFAVYLTAVVASFPAVNIGMDYAIFAAAGRDVLAGVDPYQVAFIAQRPFLNPPTALPLFVALALPSPPLGFALWTAVNGTLLVGTVFLARLGLRRLSGHEFALPAALLAIVAAALVHSHAARHCLEFGQMAIFVAFCLTAAVALLTVHRQGAAGLAMALATVKVGTVVPFLLLVRRPTYWLCWLALAGWLVVLWLLGSPPSHAVQQGQILRTELALMSADGKVNDYSYANPLSLDIIGFDHALYRLGVRDRSVIQVGQLVILTGLGGLVFLALSRQGVSRAGAFALVASVSPLFLYHRIYDTVILAIPLVYAVGKITTTHGLVRRLHTGSAFAILAVLYFPYRSLTRVQEWATHATVWGSLVQGLVLPAATWLILLSMACLCWAEWREQPTRPQLA